MTDETRELLRGRLQAASLILFLGFLAYLLRNLWLGRGGERDPVAWLTWSHIGLTVVIGLCSSFLCAPAVLAWRGRTGLRWLPASVFYSHQSSLRRLRVFETLIFGLPALYFAWVQYEIGVAILEHKNADVFEYFTAQTCLPWVCLIFVYGLFIPNSWRRAATVLALMAMTPIFVLLALRWRHEEALASTFSFDFLSALGLWLGLPAVASAYGAYNMHSLRRQAFTAKEMGAYHLTQTIGAGGMGEVYLAEHTLLKRPCAVKVIRANQAGDPKAIARFQNEVRTMARLTHWNTVEIYDYGLAEDGSFYYVMEYLPGLSLQQLVDRYGPLPPGRVIYLLRQVCGALREAHAMGFIHRDIKPGNIFAARKGGYHDVAKLLDFGLVKTVVPEETPSVKLTIDGMVIGSPLYAAPEYVVGDAEPDGRADIYALGAVAYFLVTGRPVFEGSKPLKVLFAHANEAPTPPSQWSANVPADLEAIILRCLAKQPTDRPRTVLELEAALAGCSAAGEWSADHADRWWRDRAEAFASADTARPAPASQETTMLEKPTADAIS